MSMINESAIRTPGVYTTEIPLLPPSVAQVETAVPVFIGYTEIAERKGESLSMKPTKITSLVEFRQLFGGPFNIAPGNIELKVDPTKNYTVTEVTYNRMFYLFDALRHFFDNGGGKCYIVSVGSYADAVAAGDETLTPPTGLRGGVKSVETYDEPTLILFPDAVLLSDTDFFALQQMALAQCASLQDRFSIFDLRENNTGTTTPWQTSVDNFKNRIGINALNYAACYTPWLISAFTKDINFNLLDGHVRDNTLAANLINFEMITANPDLNGLVTTIKRNTQDQTTVNALITTLRTDGVIIYPTIVDRYNKLKNDLIVTNDAGTVAAYDALVDFIELVAVSLPPLRTSLVNPVAVQSLDALAQNNGTGLRKFVGDLIALEQNTDVVALRAFAAATFTLYDPPATTWLTGTVASIGASSKDYYPPAVVSDHARALTILGDLNAIMTGLDGFLSRLLLAVQTYVKIAQDSLYKSHPIISNLVLYLQRELSKLPPSGAIAGIYALTDATRGVWKAPANVSLNSVVAPSVTIDEKIQDTLNVDDVAGKSINAIRAFTGKGTLVWGARTLDGNSSEWRYVSVRRFFIMVEESSKKATMPFVFEPNDANTWVKVRAMLENYLTVLWRQGALAGAKPEQAFFVKCGLGQTMTAQDILDGKLIIEIGMAAVRPAEFIIMRFAHKLQES